MSKKPRGAIYASYNFIDKDPVIGMAQTAVQLYAVRHKLTFQKALKKMEEGSGVKRATMRGWFYGTTRRPFFCTVAAVGIEADDPRFRAFIPKRGSHLKVASRR